MEVAWVLLDRTFSNTSVDKGNKQSISIVYSLGIFKLFFLVVRHFPHASQSLHPVSLLSLLRLLSLRDEVIIWIVFRPRTNEVSV